MFLLKSQVTKHVIATQNGDMPSCAVMFVLMWLVFSFQYLWSLRPAGIGSARLPPWEASSSPALCPHAGTGPFQREETHTHSKTKDETASWVINECNIAEESFVTQITESQAGLCNERKWITDSEIPRVETCTVSLCWFQSNRVEIH